MTESRLQRLKDKRQRKKRKLFLAAVILLFLMAAVMTIQSDLKGFHLIGKETVWKTSGTQVQQEEAGTEKPQAEDSEIKEDLQENEQDTTVQEESENEAEPAAETIEEDPNIALLEEIGEEAVLNYRIYKRYLADREIPAEGQKVVYLTIDDGPNPNSTGEILNILAEKGVKATFFVLGSMVQRYPELLNDIVDAGHGIGNHGYSHVYKIIYSSANNFLWEINETKKLIETHTGVVTNIIRAPGGTTGHFTPEYYRTVEKAGYVIQDWNVDTKDSSGKDISAVTILNNVIIQSQGKSEVVVLFHDSGRNAIIEALPRIIDYFIKENYEFNILPQDRPVAVHRPKALKDIGDEILPVLAEIQQKKQ